MRTDTISIGATKYLLAHGQNLASLERSVLHAIRGGGDMVQFTEVGNRQVRVAISQGVSVTFTSTDHEEPAPGSRRNDDAFDKSFDIEMDLWD